MLPFPENVEGTRRFIKAEAGSSVLALLSQIGTASYWFSLLI